MTTNFSKPSNRLKQKLHHARGRKNSSNRWIYRHLNDPFVKLAQEKDYRSRAAFKLEEILDKFKRIKPKQGILDIGAAPGSWLQVINRKFPHNNIVAVDLLDIEPLDNVSLVKGDIYLDSTQKQIFEHSSMFDLILCDIAPNTIGHSATDHLRLMDIAENVLELSLKCLNKDGTFIIKLFDGALKQQYQKNIQLFFDKVSFFKPKSSRKESKEIYLIALNRNIKNASPEQ